MILEELHRIQTNSGYLPEDELRSLSRRTNIPLRRIHEVASFYPCFRLEPGPEVDVRVCRDMACHLAGAPEYIRVLKSTAAELGGHAPVDRQVGPPRIRVSGVSCLGQCDAAPVVMVGHHVYRGKSIDDCRRLLRDAVDGAGAGAGAEGSLGGATDTVFTSRFKATTLPPPRPTGWRIDPYDDVPTYDTLRQFIKDPDVERVLEALKVAELRGMGGAGVPAHQKWNDVRRARGDQKYVIGNGNECAPGEFKDRELLLRAPHMILEGMILAGLVVGASRGFVYIRHEYREQIDKMRSIIRLAEADGICGSNILGSGREFNVEVFVSPGGYICGEQSALIEAMEDRRAEPRNRPPMMETNGLYDKPTLVSNVETFAWAPAIMLRGGAWYRYLGFGGYKGARFFSISGDVVRPGVYEVPIGITLGDLIFRYAGGMRDDQRLKAVATSGPSAGFLPAQIPTEFLPRAAREKLGDGPTFPILELPLDLQAFREFGLMLGAGLVVYGEAADMADQAINATEFFRNESCGKCVPCRIGTQRMVQLGTRLRDGFCDPSSFDEAVLELEEGAMTMELTSICGLGMVAPNPLMSVTRFFPEDVARRHSAGRQVLPPHMINRGQS